MTSTSNKLCVVICMLVFTIIQLLENGSYMTLVSAACPNPNIRIARPSQTSIFVDQSVDRLSTLLASSAVFGFGSCAVNITTVPVITSYNGVTLSGNDQSFDLAILPTLSSWALNYASHETTKLQLSLVRTWGWTVSALAGCVLIRSGAPNSILSSVNQMEQLAALSVLGITPNLCVADSPVAPTASYYSQLRQLEISGINITSWHKVQVSTPYDVDDTIVNAVKDGTCTLGFIRTWTIERMISQGSITSTSVVVIGDRRIAANIETNGDWPLDVAISTKTYPRYSLITSHTLPTAIAAAVTATLLSDNNMRGYGADSNTSYSWSLAVSYSSVRSLAADLQLFSFATCASGEARATTWPYFCYSCGVGFWSASGTSCDQCPSGTYTNTTGATECLTCSLQTASTISQCASLIQAEESKPFFWSSPYAPLTVALIVFGFVAIIISGTCCILWRRMANKNISTSTKSYRMSATQNPSTSQPNNNNHNDVNHAISPQYQTNPKWPQQMEGGRIHSPTPSGRNTPNGRPRGISVHENSLTVPIPLPDHLAETQRTDRDSTFLSPAMGNVPTSSIRSLKTRTSSAAGTTTNTGVESLNHVIQLRESMTSPLSPRLVPSIPTPSLTASLRAAHAAQVLNAAMEGNNNGLGSIVGPGEIPSPNPIPQPSSPGRLGRITSGSQPSRLRLHSSTPTNAPSRASLNELVIPSVPSPQGTSSSRQKSASTLREKAREAAAIAAAEQLVTSSLKGEAAAALFMPPPSPPAPTQVVISVDKTAATTSPVLPASVPLFERRSSSTPVNGSPRLTGLTVATTPTHALLLASNTASASTVPSPTGSTSSRPQSRHGSTDSTPFASHSRKPSLHLSAVAAVLAAASAATSVADILRPTCIPSPKPPVNRLSSHHVLKDRNDMDGLDSDSIGSKQVMISYSHKDTDFAKRIAASLKTADFKVWIDTDITPGEDWRSDIAHAIEGSFAVVFILSPHSVASKYCKEEIYYATNLKRHVFPVVHQDCFKHLHGGFKMLLQRIQWINFEQMGFDIAFTKLLERLRAPPSEGKVRPSFSRVSSEIVPLTELRHAPTSVQPKEVYICFSENEAKDAALARRLYADLRAAGATVALAQRSPPQPSGSGSGTNSPMPVRRSSTIATSTTLAAGGGVRRSSSVTWDLNQSPKTGRSTHRPSATAFVDTLMLPEAAAVWSTGSLSSPVPSSPRTSRAALATVSDDLWEQNAKEIDASAMIIFIASESSLTTSECADEIHYAYESEKLIVQVNVRSTSTNELTTSAANRKKRSSFVLEGSMAMMLARCASVDFVGQSYDLALLDINVMVTTVRRELARKLANAPILSPPNVMRPRPWSSVLHPEQDEGLSSEKHHDLDGTRSRYRLPDRTHE